MSAVSVRAAFSILAVVVAGCSGAGNEDLFDDSAAGKDTSSTNPVPSDPTKPSNPSTPTPGTTTPEPAPDGPLGPQPKEATCTQEIEPNNDSFRATKFVTRFCGRLDGPGDVDYATFEVPKGADTIRFDHSEKNGGGSVSYRFSIDGVPMILQNGDEIQVVPGATYSVQVRQSASSGGKPSYELDLTFQ